MSSPDESDSLDDLLLRPESGQPGDAFCRRELARTVLARTVPVLVRRRFARRCGWIAALAFCYLAGVASVSVWRSDRPNELLATRERPDKRPPATARQPIERQKSPFEALRDAGDDAWKKQGDIEAAIRLYAQALRVATPEEMKISSVDDNWILMALKEDHVKESPHADDHDKS